MKASERDGLRDGFLCLVTGCDGFFPIARIYSEKRNYKKIRGDPSQPVTGA